MAGEEKLRNSLITDTGSSLNFSRAESNQETLSSLGVAEKQVKYLRNSKQAVTSLAQTYISQLAAN